MNATEKCVKCAFTLTNNTQAKAVTDFMIANKDVSVFRDCSKVEVFGKFSKVVEFADMLDKNR